MKQKKVFPLQKSSTPSWLIWDTNMADVLLFWDTNIGIIYMRSIFWVLLVNMPLVQRGVPPSSNLFTVQCIQALTELWLRKMTENWNSILVATTLRLQYVQRLLVVAVEAWFEPGGWRRKCRRLLLHFRSLAARVCLFAVIKSDWMSWRYSRIFVLFLIYLT